MIMFCSLIELRGWVREVKLSDVSVWVVHVNHIKKTTSIIGTIKMILHEDSLQLFAIYFWNLH